MTDTHVKQVVKQSTGRPRGRPKGLIHGMPFTVRLTDGERAALLTMATNRGVSEADVVRVLIKQGLSTT